MALFCFVAGCLGLLSSTIFTAMVLAGVRHHLRRRSIPAFPARYTPPLSLLKPLHGAEPGLEASLTSFFEQEYPDFEILFCAASASDPGLKLARKVAKRYPAIPAHFFSIGGRQPYVNAKVASLETMFAESAHSILVISDSDVRVTPDYLSAVARPFANKNVGAITCLFRGVPACRSFLAGLEAVGMSVEMTAGVLVANMLEGMQFVLGPTMAVRRECVGKMGGMGMLGDYCADDFILGNQVFQQGQTVELSQHVIDHMVINCTFADSLKHQVRWMKSSRFSRPKGHFGTALTFSLPFGLLALAAAMALGWPAIGAALFAWSVVTRWVIALAAGRTVVRHPSLFGLFVLYPIRDLLGFGLWAASYLSTEIEWRGQVYYLLPGGKMRAAA